MASKTDRGDGTLKILQLTTQTIYLNVLGKTPFICNAMSEKARHELLAPRGRLSALEKATSLKHDPMLEYRGSIYAYTDEDETPTRIYFPGGAFKKAAMTASLEMEGATKASIARLVWVEETNVDLFGIPEMLMSVTRSADMNRTPDIRTRAILRSWAARISVTFIVPKLNQQAVGNLFGAAGIMVGVGDYRQEKGAGNFGQFDIVSEDNKDFQRLLKNCGRAAQDKALAEPSFFDSETIKLYQWYVDEMARRQAHGKADATAQRNGRRKAAQEEAEA